MSFTSFSTASAANTPFKQQHDAAYAKGVAAERERVLSILSIGLEGFQAEALQAIYDGTSADDFSGGSASQLHRAHRRSDAHRQTGNTD